MSVPLLGAVSAFTQQASGSGLGLVLSKDNFFPDTAGIGTGFPLAGYVMIDGDQSACVSHFCAIIAFLRRFVERERIRREKEPQNLPARCTTGSSFPGTLPITDLMVFQRGNFICLNIYQHGVTFASRNVPSCVAAAPPGRDAF